jgi:hypothetical protein
MTANRVKLAYKKETTWGVTPTGSPVLQDLRFIGETLHQETEFIQSEEIVADREITDVIKAGLHAAGDTKHHWSHLSFDEFFVAALMSSGWSTAYKVGPITTMTANGTTQRFEDSANGFTNIKKYTWIKVSGSWSNYQNIGYFKVDDVDASGGWVEVSHGVEDLITESPGPSDATMVNGPDITEGTTMSSYSVEREFTDIATTFRLFNGLTPSGMTLEVKESGIIGITFNWLGQKEQAKTATFGSGTNDPPNTRKIMSTPTNMYAVFEGGEKAAIRTMTLNLANNLRQQTQCDEIGPQSLGVGSCTVTGNATFYFKTATLANKYLNNTPTSLAFHILDLTAATTKMYTLELMRLKMTSAPVQAEGLNTDVIVNANFQAYKHEDEGKTIRIAKSDTEP